jgi:hypothetical protein
LVFPEINYDKVDKIRGMEITIVTTAQTDEEARRLLALMNMPFKRVVKGYKRGQRSRWLLTSIGREVGASMSCACAIAARCADVRAAICAGLGCAASASAAKLCKGNIPGVVKSSW